MAAPVKSHGMQRGANSGSATTGMYEELGVEIPQCTESSRPGKATSFLNPRMRTNRELILLSLSVKVNEGPGDEVTSCLDAFAATGIQALQWKKHFGEKVDVTANDIKPEVVDVIQENCRLNDCCLETTCKNANVLLHERAFKFIHLDPFGTSVNFLDAAFSNLPNNGILSVTSTDVSAFLGKCPQVTQRHYNGHLMKCEYLPELSCRLIVASLVRAAARCHKGLEVLFVFAKEHFILTVVRVRRGYKKADNSLRQVQRLLHCNLCEEREFLRETLLADDDLYSHLPCSCYKSNPGKTASLLGPVWSGNIFDASFVTEMQKSSEVVPGISTEVKTILVRAQAEAMICQGSTTTESTNDSRKREGCHLRKAHPAKAPKMDSSSEALGDRENRREVGDIREGAPAEMEVPTGVDLNTCSIDEGNMGRLAHQASSEDSLNNVGDSAEIVEAKKSDDGEVGSPVSEEAENISVKSVPVPEDSRAISFFYTVVRHCPDKGHWPRLKSVIDELSRRGHQAALTVFHSHGVRTSATLQQFIQAIRECRPGKQD